MPLSFYVFRSWTLKTQQNRSFPFFSSGQTFFTQFNGGVSTEFNHEQLRLQSFFSKMTEFF